MSILRDPEGNLDYNAQKPVQQSPYLWPKWRSRLNLAELTSAAHVGCWGKRGTFLARLTLECIRPVFHCTLRRSRPCSHRSYVYSQPDSSDTGGNTLSCHAVTSTLSERLLHKMTNSRAALIARLHVCQTSRLSQETQYLGSILPDKLVQCICRNINCLNSEVKFCPDIQRVYMAMATNTDQRK